MHVCERDCSKQMDLGITPKLHNTEALPTMFALALGELQPTWQTALFLYMCNIQGSCESQIIEMMPVLNGECCRHGYKVSLVRCAAGLHAQAWQYEFDQPCSSRDDSPP